MKRARLGGINVVQGLLENAPERIVQVWLRPESRRLNELADALRALGIGVQHADNSTLNRLSEDGHHQGVVAECLLAEPLDESDLDQRLVEAGQSTLLLALDGVVDPHNLGACLRTAAAAGVTAVIVPRDRSAPLTPAARRAAAGAAERVPLVVVTNLVRCLRRLGQTFQVWSVGLDAAAETPLYTVDLSGRLALVMGGEEKGLRRLTAEQCDTLASIPMRGQTESLNVSVAAGVALFEAIRQRGFT